MSGDINTCTFTGNLVRDPEVAATAGGTPVLSFSVASNDRRKNGATGEWEDVPNFIDCTMFGAHAESIAKFLKKGMHVTVTGKLRYSSWEKDGQKRTKLDVVASDIDFKAARRRDDGGMPPAESCNEAEPYQGAYYDADIPFDGGHAYAN